jgi:preprotein translocase subunit SecE
MFDFIRESREELKRVTWPEKEEVSNFTVVVIVTLVVVAVFLALVDMVLGEIMKLLVN